MYYYIIRDATTGAQIAEGTAEDLVQKGLYNTKASVSNSFGRWQMRKRKGVKTKLNWTRTGDAGRGVQRETQKGRTEAQIHTGRVRSWKEKAARRARQDKAAAASRSKKPDRYTTERLGNSGTLPEHKKKFAQPPKEPPEKADKLRWDVYELECLNWERRQQGKRPLSYGEWRAGIR